MSEPVIFQIARQLSAAAGLSFAEVEADLYGEHRSAPSEVGRRALVKNAVAAGREVSRVSPLARRSSQAERLAAWVNEAYPIPDEIREEYAYVFEERVSVYVYEGMPERCGSKSIMSDCCAWHRTLTEVGCVEYFSFPKGEDYKLFWIPTPKPEPVYCGRCESVGHVLASCPFGARDVDVMKAARLRRERRAGREKAA